MPWFSSGETRSSFVDATEKTITERGVRESSARRVRAGSTVVAGAGQGKTRGQASFLLIDTYINQSTVALVPDPAQVTDLFLFFDVSRRYDEFRAMSDSHSSRGSLTSTLLASLELIVPARAALEAFDRVATHTVERIADGLAESRTLAELRDLLLPRLLSGELRMREAEKAVEKVL